MRFKSMAFQKLDHKPQQAADMIHRSQSKLADNLKTDGKFKSFGN